MSELFKIFLTSGLTIIGGVSIYAFGQIVLKFFIEPVQEQKRLIGEISSAIIHYSTICTEGRFKDFANKNNEAAQRFMILSKDLLNKTLLIPYYKIFEKIYLVIPIKSINDVTTELYMLSDLFLVPLPIDYQKIGETMMRVAKVLKP